MELKPNRRADRLGFHARDVRRAKLLKGLRDFAGTVRQQLGRQIVIRKGIGSANVRKFELTLLRAGDCIRN